MEPSGERLAALFAGDGGVGTPHQEISYEYTDQADEDGWGPI